MTTPTAGCAVCGEDALPGQLVRVADWFLLGSQHIHEDCFQSLHTNPRELKRIYPRLSALSVTTFEQ